MATTKELNNFVVNKVASKAVYDSMVASQKINDDELYLVLGDEDEVRYTAQSLTAEQQAQARTNIGAGTSSFSGAYKDLSGKPTIPSKVSELDNDAGYLTEHQSLDDYAPVNHSHATATQNAAGFLSANDKKKLDGIQESADAVSVSRSLTSGTKIATITINGTGTDLYCETNTNTDTKVTQNSDTSTTGTVPILLAYQASPTSGTAGAAKYTSKAGVKPSTGQFVSTVATGTAPMTVSSKTVVTNFNADQLDGYDAASFVLATDYAALETALAAI
nr:MAG TPA: hypothetical protein [Bacteriophage sp.]